MQNVDLNLLTSLDILLTERNVTRAARRLGLSPSAMSRTLSRLRATTGDQLLVQAGRALVLTPYAEQLCERVHELARDARTVLQPSNNILDIAILERTFTIRANDGFVDLVCPSLMDTVTQTAPHVRICFVPKSDKEAQPLREGMIDLEVGVIGTKAPELKTRLLFYDRFVGICRTGHPLLSKPGVTAERYASYPHVVASRKRKFSGPVDDALEKLGLLRNIVMVVPSYANVMRVARCSDLIGLVPRSSLVNGSTRDTTKSAGLQFFDLPMRTPPIEVSAIWHPRLHADPAHRWFRETILTICRNAQLVNQ